MRNRDNNSFVDVDISEGDNLVNYLMLFPTDVSEGFVLQENGSFILVQDGSGGKLLIEA